MRKRYVLSSFVALAVAGGLLAPLPAHAGAVATRLDIFTILSNKESGQSFQVQVQAEDNANSRDQSYTGQITLAAAAPTGGSNFVGGNQPLNATAGLATFNVTLNNAADDYEITATASGLTSDDSNTFDVTATALAVTTGISNKKAGTSFNVNAQARDGNDNLAENFNGTVTLSASAVGGQSFAGGNPSVSASGGGIEFTSLELNNAADDYTVTSTSTGLTSGVSGPFDITATHVAIIGNLSNVKAGNNFNVIVEARDVNDVRAENFTGSITISAAATGGSTFAGGNASLNAVAGTGSFLLKSLNNAADDYTVTATSAGLTGDDSNTFDVTATNFVVTTNMANKVAGTAFDVAVEARDNDNNIAENFNGSVNLNAAATTGGSNFVGGQKTQTASAGSVAFDDVVINNAANSYRVTASGTGPNNGPSTFFAVTATHLTVLTIADNRAGDGFSVSVEGRDADNNKAENFGGFVSLAAAATGGSNFPGPPGANAVAGTATVNTSGLNNAADEYEITATSGTLTSGVSNEFDVTARSLGFLSGITDKKAGTAFDVTVQARDANGIVAENFDELVNLDAAATGGSNFVGGQKSVVAVAGMATFDDVVINNAADGYQVTASRSGLISGVSNNFAVTASSLTVLTVADARAGDGFAITVEGRDADNNKAENFTGFVNIAAAATGGSNFVSPPGANAVAGTASFSNLILNNAANNYQVTASSGGLTNGLSNTFDVTAHHLVVTTTLGNVKAGTPFDVTVQARDGNNNLAENFNDSIGLAAAATGGSNFGTPPSENASSGQVTFDDVVLGNAANGYSVTASASGVISGVSNSFNVTATHLAVLPLSDSKSGNFFGVTVEARDADNNLAENFTGLVGLSAAATGGSNFSTTPSKNAVAGSAVFDPQTLHNAADGYTITATSTGLTNGVSNSFNVTAQRLVITTIIGNMGVDDPFDVTVEARDSNDNVAENYDSSVDLTASATGGSNFDGGPPSAAAAAGMASFNDLSLDDAADGYQLTASQGNVDDGVSNAFNVTALEVARTLSLNLIRHLKSKGQLDGGPTRCSSQKKVNIQKRRPNGKWKTIKKPTTNTDGAFSTKIPDQGGKYRAKVPKLTLESPTTICSAATSLIATHTH